MTAETATATAPARPQLPLLATGLATMHAPNRPTVDLSRCRNYDIVPEVLAANPPSTGVNCIAATRGLRWLFTAGDDGLVRKYDFWGSMNGKARLTASQMQGLPESLNKSAVLLGSIENEESTRATTLSTVPTTSSMELDAAMEENNDDNAVATAAADDAHSPTDGNATSNHGLSPVLCMDIHSEAVWGVTGTMNGAVNLFTIRHDQGTIVHVLKHHTDAVSTMRIMPGQQALLTGAWDRTLAITDLNTGQLVSRFMAHKSNVTAVELRPCTGQTGDVDSDGNVFLSASYDGQCLVWDRRASEKPAYVFAAVAPCPPWALSATWSADGQRIYVARRNECVEEFDIRGACASGRLFRLPKSSGPVSSVVALPNNRHIVWYTQGAALLWKRAILLMTDPKLKMPVPYQIVPGHHGGMVSAQFIDPDHRILVTASGHRGYSGYTHTASSLFYEINGVQ